MAELIKKDIVVIGAGLTGLTTGFYLNKYGKDVVILEKADRCGGVINSVQENGFIYETGPNSGVLSTVEAVELFEDLNQLCKLETARAESKKRLILKNGQWEPLPSGLSSAISTPLFTLKDKLRILGEPFREKGNNPHESVAELVRRRLGKSFLDYAIDPFISGIYAGDPENIVTKYALPKLYDLEQEYGSFIKGSIAKMKNADKKAKKATREVFSAKNGLGKLISALCEGIGEENIKLNCNNISINKSDKFEITFETDGDIKKIESNKVITTTGSHALEEMLPFIPKNRFDNISNLRYAKVVQVILGFNNWQGISLQAFGGLIPSKEKRKILGVLYSSSLFEDRAPVGGALLSIFLGGMKFLSAVDLSDQEITHLVKIEITDIMGLKDFNPDLMKIFRYQYAIPQYEASSGSRFEAIRKLQEEYPGLILAGNMRDGIGMSDRIKQAKNIADSLK